MNRIQEAFIHAAESQLKTLLAQKQQLIKRQVRLQKSGGTPSKRLALQLSSLQKAILAGREEKKKLAQDPYFEQPLRVRLRDRLSPTSLAYLSKLRGQLPELTPE